MNIKLLKNINYMLMAQAANYVMPLVLVPYLVRSIGLVEYGYFSVAQALINVGLIVVQFGFNIHVTKEIALLLKNKMEIASLVTSALVLQILLALLLISIVGGYFYLDGSRMAGQCFYYSFSLFGQALFPIWYFQGKQRFRALSGLNFFLRASAFVIILIEIKKPEDAAWLPVIYAISYLMTGIGAMILLCVEQRLQRVTWRKIYELFMECKDLFYSNLISSLLMNMPVFFLNHLLSKEQVGAFSAILRVIYAIKGMANSVFQVLLPMMINQGKIDPRKLSQYIFVVTLYVVWGGIAFSPYMQLFLFGWQEGQINGTVYNILFLSLVPGIMATLFIFVFATYYSKYKIRRRAFVRVGVMAAILYYPVITFWYETGAAMVILICESVLFLLGRRVLS